MKLVLEKMIECCIPEANREGVVLKVAAALQKKKGCN